MSQAAPPRGDPQTLQALPARGASPFAEPTVPSAVITRNRGNAESWVLWVSSADPRA